MSKDLSKLLKETLEAEAEKRKLFPGGMLTLLDIPGRKELPEVDRSIRHPLLVDIVEHTPDLYAELITIIRSGAYIHVAAEAIGITERALRKWIQQGGKDVEAELDTYYARFVYDIRRAIAQCRADKERKVAETDPKTWLSKGPGRIFGDQWGKKEQVRIEEEVQDAIDVQIAPKSIGFEEEDTPDKVQMDAKTQLEAIEALEAAGQSTYSTEFKNNLRRQAGLPIVEE